MHALNNYLGGPYVTRDDCGLAAAHVCTIFSEAGDGDAELLAWHLNPDSGWLSIDVINALGSTLGLAVDGADFALNKLLEEEEVACLVNCNNAHWTVLQQRSRHGPWVHTNSIEGHASFHGHRTLAGVVDVFRLMEAIQEQYGGVALHKIRRTDALEGLAMLEAEGLRALLPPEVAQEPQQEGRSAASLGNRVSLVSLNVDGFGAYDKTPCGEDRHCAGPAS